MLSLRSTFSVSLFTEDPQNPFSPATVECPFSPLTTDTFRQVDVEPRAETDQPSASPYPRRALFRIADDPPAIVPHLHTTVSILAFQHTLLFVLEGGSLIAHIQELPSDVEGIGTLPVKGTRLIAR